MNKRRLAVTLLLALLVIAGNVCVFLFLEPDVLSTKILVCGAMDVATLVLLYNFWVI